MKISRVYSLEILDSRGFPSVEVVLISESGLWASSSSPSGASTGSLEAFEKRDFHLSRFKGRGVASVVDYVNNTFSSAVCGKNFFSQREFDVFLLELDGSPNKQNLGGNCTISLSMAFAKLFAIEQRVDLYSSLAKTSIGMGTLGFKSIESSFVGMPAPMINILNGGRHADNPINIQEFMIIPIGADSFRGAIEIGGNVFHALKDILSAKKLNTNVGDEGGFAPDLKDPREALDLILQAVELSGYVAGKDVLFALDCAASEFYDQEVALYKLYQDSKGLSAEEMLSFYEKMISDYPIFSIEDPFSEHDIEGARQMTKKMRDKVQIVGDDFFVTNIDVFKEREDICNAILIKPNQIGTVSEAIEVVNYAASRGFNCIASHRSGETEDTFIADFSVGTACNQIKTGSLCRTDRNCKYNQLLRIENGITTSGRGSIIFAGDKIISQFNDFRK